MFRIAVLSTKTVFVCLFLVMALARAASAAEPDAVLQEIVDKIKAAENPSPVVDYVRWDEAFSKMTPEQKQSMKITSPAEMRELYRRVLRSPVSLMKSQFEEKLKSNPPPTPQAAEQQKVQLDQMMAQKEKEIKDRIGGTVYVVGKSVVEGNTAIVELTQTYEGQSKTEGVKLIRTGDTWMLPSVAMAGGPADKTPRRAKDDQPEAAAPAVSVQPNSATLKKSAPAVKLSPR